MIALMRCTSLQVQCGAHTRAARTTVGRRHRPVHPHVGAGAYGLSAAVGSQRAARIAGRDQHHRLGADRRPQSCCSSKTVRHRHAHDKPVLRHPRVADAAVLVLLVAMHSRSSATTVRPGRRSTMPKLKPGRFWPDQMFMDTVASFAYVRHRYSWPSSRRRRWTQKPTRTTRSSCRIRPGISWRSSRCSRFSGTIRPADRHDRHTDARGRGADPLTVARSKSEP